MEPRGKKLISLILAFLLEVDKEWGLCMLTKKDIEDSECITPGNKDLRGKKSSDEDQAMIDEVKRKEIGHSNLGLLTA